MRQSEPTSGPYEDAVDHLAEQVSRIRPRLLQALRDHQSLVILSSLSLVVAAFSQNVSETAVSYGVAASVAFLMGLGLSMLHGVMGTLREIDSSDSLIVGGLALVGIALGFLLLGLVVNEFSAKFMLASRVVSIVTGGFAILLLGVIVLRTWGRLPDIRDRDAQLWERWGGRLAAASMASAGSYVVIVGSWLAGYAGTTVPAWVWGAAVAALFGPSFVVVRIHRSVLRASRGEAQRP